MPFAPVCFDVALGAGSPRMAGGPLEIAF